LFFVREDGPEAAITALRRQWERAELRENLQSTGPLVDRIFQQRPPDGNLAEESHLRLFLKGTNFQVKVWEALLRIPEGMLCSYQDIARYLGKPTAARAVGSAVAQNPIAYIIPCHRVIKKIGILGNYRYGAIRKKLMIGWEMTQRYNREDVAN
jgi:AraC family transcriptional regulator of adaptative response/methylated-DNA-[protein]-cysteine methyltransferase